MGKAPKPFEMTLTEDEAAEISKPSGQGGHQSLHKRLLAVLDTGSRIFHFNDCELGELVRYMTQYGSGGFQGRLRKAFTRSLVEQLGVKNALF
jgi:hypothetical protein